MNRTYIYFWGLFFCLFPKSFSQQSHVYLHDGKQFQDALKLYNDQQYQAAQILFKKVELSTEDYETRANSIYYYANSAIRMGERGADKLMEEFVAEYPTSTKRNSAFFDVGDYYFETGKYPYALKWYKKVDRVNLSKNDGEKYNFRMGYVLYSTKQRAKAEELLKEVVDSPKYGSQAKYYLGYISYENDDYEGANQRFDAIADSEILKEKMDYYQADLNFKLGNFEKAIAMAQKHMPKAQRNEVSELNKIIGESYFNLANYQEAIQYLEKYNGKSGRWSNTDYYLLGYSYYKNGDFQSAVDQFNKIIDGDDSVAQNAYYHLAECYLKLYKKSEALNAFRNASQMDFNEDISKDALLNYARLSYEIGNAYEPVPKIMADYLEAYPRDEHKNEVLELLVDSYITSQNFEEALLLIESDKSFADKETYQKVAYYWATELFLEEDYKNAMAIFSKSLKNTPNGVFESKALFWKAETAYRLNLYEQAKEGFIEFRKHSNAKNTEEYKELNYNLGYTYFKIEDYENAIVHFDKAVKAAEIEQEYLWDSYLRLGDGYFVSKNYGAAISAYEKYLKENMAGGDYAAFQKAISYGFLGKNSKKINGLNQFLNKYPDSEFQDDALFELANSYVKTSDGALGMMTYDRLVTDFGDSKFAPKALLRQGLVHYNANNNEEALVKFKTLVREYPVSEEAKQAVDTAKLIYIDLGRVSEYADWIRGLSFVEITDSELEAASFESAESKYNQGRHDIAIKAFEEYLREYPNGINSIKANFRLGQLYYLEGDANKAVSNYIAVATNRNNEFTEQALTRVAEIYIGTGDYPIAMPYLERLESEATIEQNRTFAQSNLMKGHFLQKDYERTLELADKVLSSPKIDDRIISDAKTMIARSAIATKRYAVAELAYQEVREVATGNLAAEAWYYDAFFKNRNKDFEASNVSVQKLVKSYSGQKEWAAKGLILMAKNYHALDDAFQATYILESVVKNFAEYEEIANDAANILAKIKMMESERNSSVDPNEN